MDPLSGPVLLVLAVFASIVALVLLERATRPEDVPPAYEPPANEPRSPVLCQGPGCPMCHAYEGER